MAKHRFARCAPQRLGGGWSTRLAWSQPDSCELGGDITECQARESPGDKIGQPLPTSAWPARLPGQRHNRGSLSALLFRYFLQQRPYLKKKDGEWWRDLCQFLMFGLHMHVEWPHTHTQRERIICSQRVYTIPSTWQVLRTIMLTFDSALLKAMVIEVKLVPRYLLNAHHGTPSSSQLFLRVQTRRTWLSWESFYSTCTELKAKETPVFIINIYEASSLDKGAKIHMFLNETLFPLLWNNNGSLKSFGLVN